MLPGVAAPPVFRKEVDQIPKKPLKRIPTTRRLAKALQDLNDPKLANMIKRAKEGYYDNYKTSIATPIIQLVKDLQAAGYPEMAERAKSGEWDARSWEGREWYQNEGRAQLNAFLRNDKRKGLF